MLRRLLPIAAVLVAPAWITAQSAPDAHVSPIADALEELGEDVRVFDQHLVTLANPFMEGRLPGTRGMEIAKEYCEHYLKKAGLEPAFETENGAPSWRQPFPLGGTLQVSEATLDIKLGGETVRLEAGSQFNVLGLGGSGSIENAPITFIGYGIQSGPDGFVGWSDDANVEGHVLVAFRFEPMDNEGKSLWSERGPWSRRSQWRSKLDDLAKLHPAAVIFVNPPGCADPRSQELIEAGKGGRRAVDFPVLMVDTNVAEKLCRKVGGASLMNARVHADRRTSVKRLNGTVSIQAAIERKALIAENVGGIIPGRGALANEVVVMGAHLDHLGMGEFGSRSGPGELHPGADDNASGSAAVLMLADKLKQAYDAMPADAEARTLLFLLFSGEESGLNGSAYYVEHPIRPLEEHALMCNFDMIGRIKDGRLSVSGTDSARGMKEWLQPLFEASPLDIVQPKSIMAASDHAVFVRKQIPVLFAIIAEFHGDYHTPRDVSSKINRVGSAQTVQLFAEILKKAATWPERFEFQRAQPRERQTAEEDEQPNRTGARVRFGIAPGTYDEDATGVAVADVGEGTSAEDAGIKAGDRLVTWNGEKIGDVRAWMGMLMQHKPGDVVQVGVERDGKVLELAVTLKSR
ncbi:MAG: M28 family peptidase [Planctomycetes bacterium]|nr:M28 family peptidase [Planctomycetota bacterium]